MERPGFVLDSSNDVERQPGRYQTSEEWMAIVDRAVSMPFTLQPAMQQH